MIIMNPPPFVSTVWSCLKHFLSDRQQAKTVFAKKDIVTGRCAKHQLEEQYGGSMPSITQYYPFTFPPGPFDAEHVGGAATDAIPHGHKCINARTAKGVLAVGENVPKTRWSSKGAELLNHLSIELHPHHLDPSPPHKLSGITDFPDSSFCVNADLRLHTIDHDELARCRISPLRDLVTKFFERIWWLGQS